MKLHTETTGTGPELVLIHGWGLHGGIWEPLLPLLAPHFRVTVVDLPGHGNSEWQDSEGLPAFADAVLASVPQQAAWLGWSLGGLVALQAALQAPGRVTRLIAVAANPSFVSRPAWPDGVDAAVFSGFARDLSRDFQGTLNRFLLLESLGSDTARADLARLRAGLESGRSPAPEALRAGLELLRGSDLSGRLGELEVPSLWLAGGRDRLVPPQAMAQAAARAPGASSAVIPGAGHAPFIGHEREFVRTVSTFMQARAAA